MQCISLTIDLSSHILLSRSYSSEFDTLRMKFGSTFCKVIAEIKKSSHSLDELKSYLSFCKPDMKTSDCQTIDELLQVAQKDCTLINVAILEGIVEHFKIKTASKFLKNYCKIIDEFCGTISLQLCLHKKFSMTDSCSSLKCEVAKFVLDWEPADPRTLDDIRDVLSIAFKNISKHVQVIIVTPGNSITITCRFPMTFGTLLINEATKNLENLKGIGLLQLTIGYTTVWKKLLEVVSVNLCTLMLCSLLYDRTHLCHSMKLSLFVVVMLQNPFMKLL